jgi:dTDP-L-rhamnose 4-epimerase
MATRALVTGGCGLIGSHLADLLLDEGYEVRVLDNLERVTHGANGGRPVWTPADVDFWQADMRDFPTGALKGVSEVYHLAAYGGFAPELAKMTEVNIVGTARLLEAVRASGVRKLVVASSQAVYGEGMYRCPTCLGKIPGFRPVVQLEAGVWEQLCDTCSRPLIPVPTVEEAPLRGSSVYALAKLMQERLCLGVGAEWGLPVVALRFALTYGPRQSVRNPYTGICSIFSTRLLNGLPPVVYEDGVQQRDFTFVGDVARALLHVMRDGRADGHAFNVGTGKGTTVWDFATMLARAYGVSMEPVLFGEFRPADARHLVANPGSLNELGWEAQVPVEDGVGLYADWFRAQPLPREVFTEAEKELRSLGVVRG